MSDDCIFCRIVEGKIPSCKVCQDELTLAFLDIGPLSEGHCLLIPRQHYARLDECPAATLAALGRNLGPLARAVVDVVGAEGYNVLNNNDRCAGQLVEHIHFHIIPRNPGDGVFTQWPAGEYPEGRIEQLAENIKKLL